MIYIGIDPGMSGAIAVISPHGIALLDVPIVDTGKGREYDLDGLLRAIPTADGVIAKRVALEHIGAFPKASKAALFKLGYGCGLIQMAVVSKGLPIVLVRPQVWKKEFNLIGKNKAASRLRALEIFPQVREELKRVKDEGRAEALLIAEWLRRQQGSLPF